MAIKPTIYKFDVALADLDRNRYDELAITVARHPSETVERMMVRLLVYCLNAEEGLEFASGLSDAEEPDLWHRELHGQLLKWIDVGEPSAERARKAAGRAEQVLVYSFNSKSDVWWRTTGPDVRSPRVRVYRIPWEQAQQLGALARRTLKLSVTVAAGSAFVAAESGECEVSWQELERAD